LARLAICRTSLCAVTSVPALVLRWPIRLQEGDRSTPERSCLRIAAGSGRVVKLFQLVLEREPALFRFFDEPGDGALPLKHFLQLGSVA
jgi:hypothetical protein